MSSNSTNRQQIDRMLLGDEYSASTNKSDPKQHIIKPIPSTSVLRKISGNNKKPGGPSLLSKLEPSKDKRSSCGQLNRNKFEKFDSQNFERTSKIDKNKKKNHETEKMKKPKSSQISKANMFYKSKPSHSVNVDMNRSKITHGIRRSGKERIDPKKSRNLPGDPKIISNSLSSIKSISNNYHAYLSNQIPQIPTRDTEYTPTTLLNIREAELLSDFDIQEGSDQDLYDVAYQKSIVSEAKSQLENLPTYTVGHDMTQSMNDLRDNHERNTHSTSLSDYPVMTKPNSTSFNDFSLPSYICKLPSVNYDQSNSDGYDHSTEQTQLLLSKNNIGRSTYEDTPIDSPHSGIPDSNINIINSDRSTKTLDGISGAYNSDEISKGDFKLKSLKDLKILLINNQLLYVNKNDLVSLINSELKNKYNQNIVINNNNLTINELIKTNKTLSSDYVNLEKNMESVRDDLSNLETENQILKEKVESYIKFQSNIDETNNEFNNLKNKYDQLIQENSRSKDFSPSNNFQNRQISELTRKNEILENELGQYKEVYFLTYTNLNKFANLFRNSESEHNKLYYENELLKSQHEILQNKYNDILQQYNIMNDTFEELHNNNNKIEQLELDNGILRNKIKALESNIENQQKVIEKLKSDYDMVQTEYNSLYKKNTRSEMKSIRSPTLDMGYRNRSTINVRDDSNQVLKDQLKVLKEFNSELSRKYNDLLRDFNHLKTQFTPDAKNNWNDSISNYFEQNDPLDNSLEFNSPILFDYRTPKNNKQQGKIDVSIYNALLLKHNQLESENKELKSQLKKYPDFPEIYNFQYFNESFFNNIVELLNSNMTEYFSLILMIYKELEDQHNNHANELLMSNCSKQLKKIKLSFFFCNTINLTYNSTNHVENTIIRKYMLQNRIDCDVSLISSPKIQKGKLLTGKELSEIYCFYLLIYQQYSVAIDLISRQQNSNPNDSYISQIHNRYRNLTGSPDPADKGDITKENTIIKKKIEKIINDINTIISHNETFKHENKLNISSDSYSSY